MAKKRFIGEGVLFVPKIANDKEKRDRIKDIRKSRRESIKTASTREEKESIRQSARENIRAERGGMSQAKELFTDVKDFTDQVNQLKSNVENTTVGRVARLAKDVVGHISSANLQGIVNDVEKARSLIKGNRNGNTTVKKDSGNSNCSC